MDQTIFKLIEARVSALETILSDLREDLALTVEQSQRLRADLEAQSDHSSETVARCDALQRQDLHRIERRLETDLDRIRYDISCLEARCSALEHSGRW